MENQDYSLQKEFQDDFDELKQINTELDALEKDIIIHCFPLKDKERVQKLEARRKNINQKYLGRDITNSIIQEQIKIAKETINRINKLIKSNEE